jgi:tetratricopeptide (TPR) repeat protein
VEPEELGPLQIIKNAIPPRFVAVLDGQIRTCHNRYWSSGNKSHLKEAEPITQELLSVDPNHYGGRLIKGMCQFVLYRDIEGALETIESCNSVSECTWQYNAAFLKAYQKDLNGAYHYYSKAFSAPIVLETVPIQTEEFIHRVLQEEPNQSQLWFCLGLINYRDKGDLVAAKADFEKFLENTNPNEFELQHTTVVKWLKRINIRLQ